MKKEPNEPYIYQPYGMVGKEFWKDKKVYGIGGYGLATIKGISKELAEKILQLIKEPPCKSKK